MNKIKFIAAGLLLFVLASFTGDNLSKEFTDLLNRTKLTFDKPEGMIETKCIENSQMNYDYALKDTIKNFEVRYAIRPMDSALAQYETSKKRGDFITHPNMWSASDFKVTLINIGMGGTESKVLPQISRFDSTAVKNEFNADWGAIAFVNLGPEFGGPIYKYCIAVIIHRDFIGDAYSFYLSDSKDNISSLMKKPFHSLKFK